MMRRAGGRAAPVRRARIAVSHQYCERKRPALEPSTSALRYDGVVPSATPCYTRCILFETLMSVDDDSLAGTMR